MRTLELGLASAVLASAAATQVPPAATAAPAERDMMLGGPGATESPYTVDVGRLQTETVLLGLGSNHFEEDGARLRFDRLTAGFTNLRWGVHTDWEVQVVLDPYTKFTGDVDGVRENVEGFGDTALRFKCNVWGNDVENNETAFGFVPYVWLPTGDEELGAEHAQVGAVLAFACWLPQESYLELSATVQSGSADDRGMAYGLGVSVGHTVCGALDGYLEFALAAEGGTNAEAFGVFGGGLIWCVTPDVQVYGGGDVGLTGAAEDWSLFLGVAFRL